MEESPHRAGGGPAGSFAVWALGCRVNQEELESLRSQLLSRGLREVPFGEPADLTVVNTCTVTAAGDSDGRQTLRKARRSSPGGRIVATGCYAQRDPEALEALGVADLILGNAAKGDLARYLDLLKTLPADGAPTPSCSEVVMGSRTSASLFLPYAPGWAPARTRAALKIQDGCDEHCTYCIIPEVRGPSGSRPAGDVLADARRLAAAGVKEIVVTGVNTGSYGTGDGAPDLARLLAALEAVEPLRRIRLSSVEPGHVTADLLEAFARSPKLCPHLHIPLQSGDDEILKRMGRTYRSADYAALLAQARRVRPGVAIGGDVMVGFPGETPARFERSLAFIEAMEFCYLHVFTYSPRPGSPATRLDGAVAPAEAARRSRKLRGLDRLFRRRHMDRRTGDRAGVLVEERKGEDAVGLTGDYLRVVTRTAAEPGEMIDVILSRPEDDRRMRARAAGAPRHP
jgi:threonylcarbamoyladenosine tRNA methylthiotransferase MtaB